jgi:hypothetical protein
MTIFDQNYFHQGPISNYGLEILHMNLGDTNIESTPVVILK